MSNKQQYTLMFFDPTTGDKTPYPSHAQQYREWHGPLAWLYCPWTGLKRDPLEIGMDVFGHLILPKGEPLYTDNHAESTRLSLGQNVIVYDRCRFNRSVRGVVSGVLEDGVQVELLESCGAHPVVYTFVVFGKQLRRDPNCT